MRNLIVALILILITSYGHSYDGGIVHIDKDLIPYVREFQNDCERYGWDPNYLNELRTIELSDTDYEYNAHGITIYETGEIFIDYELLTNETGLRMVVYHELAHWYGLSHDEYGIMQSNYDACECVNEDFEDNWDEYVEYMMLEQ